MKLRDIVSPTLRFWFWHRGGWVKISLRAGQQVHHFRRFWNGEGNSWEEFSLIYSARGGQPEVIQEWGEGGRDCDGYTQSRGVLMCPRDRLASLPAYDDGTASQFFGGLRIHRPDWQKLGPVRCHDEYAEAAGY